MRSSAVYQSRNLYKVIVDFIYLISKPSIEEREAAPSLVLVTLAEGDGDAEQVMIKIFIGGSRKVTRLTDELHQRIDLIIENHYPILIGDANGADRAVQQYLYSRGYEQVEVFCIEGVCRNNVGGWPVHSVPAPNNKKDFSYYEAKDKVMADVASIGLMIWDGRSLGTIMNAFRLINHGKKVVVYVAPRKEYSNLKSSADLEKLISDTGSELGLRMKARIGTGEQRYF